MMKYCHGRHGMKTDRAQNIPRGHLADVFVAAQTGQAGAVGVIGDEARPFLREPRFARVGEEISRVMHRFVGLVAVGVPFETGGRLLEKFREVT